MSEKPPKQASDEEMAVQALLRVVFGKNIGGRITLFIVLTIAIIFLANNQSLVSALYINLTTPEQSAEPEESVTTPEFTEYKPPPVGYSIDIQDFHMDTEDRAIPTPIYIEFGMSLQDIAKEFTINLLLSDETVVSYEVQPSFYSSQLLEENSYSIIQVTGTNFADGETISIYALLDNPSLLRVEIQGESYEGYVFKSVHSREDLEARFGVGNRNAIKTRSQHIGDFFLIVGACVFITLVIVALIKFIAWVAST